MEIEEAYLNGIYQGKIRHPFYNKTVSHAEDMGVHLKGDRPEKILSINRPNELEEVKKYRLDSYQPVTISLSEKVINTVNKVFNPRLWRMNFPESNIKGNLENYLTEGYPLYRSLMNFISETFTQECFSDANAAVLVEPESFDIKDTSFFKPVVKIVASKYLVDFSDAYYTFLFEDKIRIYTDTHIQEFCKKKDQWSLTFEYAHEFNFIPVFITGGSPKMGYFESFIAGVLPHWNQVIQLTSDLQASYMNHLFPQKWEFTTECDNDNCVGGSIKTELSNELDGLGNPVIVDTKCSRCNGSGKVSRSPYGVHTINRDSINPDAPLPTPPFGYESPPIDVVEKVEDRISKEEKRGLSSINMEIVQMVGNDQSGAAKTVDREDLNAFLSRYSRHVFQYVIPNIIRSIAAWRHPDNFESLLPEIQEPKDFNILSLDRLTEEYKDASNANVSNSYLRHIENEIIQSKFANNEFSRKKNKAIVNLQPYPAKSPDDLLTLKALGEPQWRINQSINIIQIVEAIIDRDEGFLDLSLTEQRKIVDAEAKKTENGDLLKISTDASGAAAEVAET